MISRIGRQPTILGTLGVFLIVALIATTASASGISGTLSNFDTFYDNTTTPDKDAYGAELELEGCHLGDVSNTYPSHYDSIVPTEYSDGVNFGTRITFSGYNFDPSSYIAPTPNPQTTNGHLCVGTTGCEHFGFAVGTQPTATRFFWLDQNGARISTTPLSVPSVS